MAKTNNIVHLYFRKEDGNGKTLLKINPIHLTGTEIVVPATGEPEMHDVEVPNTFEAELPKEGFVTCSPLEFNLYLNGLV